MSCAGAEKLEDIRADQEDVGHLRRIFVTREAWWDEDSRVMNDLHAKGLVRFGHGLILELTDKGRVVLASADSSGDV